MIINHNMNAMNAHRMMMGNTSQAGKSMEKLSSGLRINRAGDDAAGLAISEKMRGQIRGLDQAARNSQDGISMIQTAEGALNETHSILQRMRELATQAANDTNVNVDRREIQKEINQLTSEINRIGNTTEFNTKKLINGDMKGAAAANNESVKFDFTSLVSATNANGNVKLTVGGATYTLKFDNTVNGTAAFTYATATKTFTIGTITNAPKGTEATFADSLKKAFEDARGANPSLSLSQFDFTADGANKTFTITARSTGEYAGATGKDSIEFAGGLAVVVNKLQEGKDGAGGKAMIQVGANTAQDFAIEVNDMRALALKVAGTKATGTVKIDGITASYVAATITVNGVQEGNKLTDISNSGTNEYALDISDHDKATAAIKIINSSIESVSAERSKLGAYQNRLEHTIANLGTSSENLSAAESRIRDVDMAKEMMAFSKNNILSQAAQAMLAQANQQPQGVLQLLR